MLGVRCSKGEDINVGNGGAIFFSSLTVDLILVDVKIFTPGRVRDFSGRSLRFVCGGLN